MPRDAHGRFVKGDSETARAGGSALQRQIAALRSESDRLQAGLAMVRQVLADHDAGLDYPATVGRIRGILGHLADDERR